MWDFNWKTVASSRFGSCNVCSDIRIRTKAINICLYSLDVQISTAYYRLMTHYLAFSLQDSEDSNGFFSLGFQVFTSWTTVKPRTMMQQWFCLRPIWMVTWEHIPNVWLSCLILDRRHQRKAPWLHKLLHNDTMTEDYKNRISICWPSPLDSGWWKKFSKLDRN